LSGVSDQLWSVGDIVDLIETREAIEDGTLIVGYMTLARIRQWALYALVWLSFLPAAVPIAGILFCAVVYGNECFSASTRVGILGCLMEGMIGGGMLILIPYGSFHTVFWIAGVLAGIATGCVVPLPEE
jgi:hypothetical protein